jgi:hypothetical protein
MLPFTRDQFVTLFGTYNDAVWPIQVLAYLLGLAMAVMVVRPSITGNHVIGSGLALMWVWTGISYHWLFFSSINKAALLFGALFVLQGALLFYVVVVRGRVSFGTSHGLTSWLGWIFVMYAAVVYPLLGMLMGHRYPEMPMFGITPCPLTIFTFGLMLLTTTPVSRWLLVIPFVWSLIGGSAAFLLGVPQDWFLLVSGIAIPLILLRDRSISAAARMRAVAAASGAR